MLWSRHYHLKGLAFLSIEGIDLAVRLFEYPMNMPLGEGIEFQRFIFGPTGIGVYLL